MINSGLHCWKCKPSFAGCRVAVRELEAGCVHTASTCWKVSIGARCHDRSIIVAAAAAVWSNTPVEWVGVCIRAYCRRLRAVVARHQEFGQLGARCVPGVCVMPVECRVDSERVCDTVTSRTVHIACHAMSAQFKRKNADKYFGLVICRSRYQGWIVKRCDL